MKKYYVYELINLYGTVEDVGETLNPKNRFKQHTKIKPIVGRSGFGKFYKRQDIIMNIVAEFDNRKEARKLETELKVSYGLQPTERIRDANNARTNHAKNIQNGHYNKMAILSSKKTSKPILVYKIDGTFIGEYKSQIEFAREINVVSSRVSEVCLNKRKEIKGYITRYKPTEGET